MRTMRHALSLLVAVAVLAGLGTAPVLAAARPAGSPPRPPRPSLRPPMPPLYPPA